jgi:hypothetical protein
MSPGSILVTKYESHVTKKMRNCYIDLQEFLLRNLRITGICFISPDAEYQNRSVYVLLQNWTPVLKLMRLSLS